MDAQLITSVLALAALVFSVTVFALRWMRIVHLPLAKDKSVPKGSVRQGLVYAFSLGMAPWAKESTRRHWVAYLRGILFHIGIFAGLVALLASPWWKDFDPNIRILFAILAGAGAVAGILGGLMRIIEHNLKAISTPDDHASVWLVSLFLTVMALALLWEVFIPAMYVVSALMLLYAPLGKIRHSVYFFFGRLFFGLHIGRRGIVRGLREIHDR